MRSLTFRAFIALTLLIHCFGSSIGMAFTTAQRHLTQSVSWSSCNRFNICYQLKANQVEIGFLANSYYASPIEITIQRKLKNGHMQVLRRITASEGKWNYDRNQWVLLITENHTPKEFIFSPDTLEK